MTDSQWKWWTFFSGTLRMCDGGGAMGSFYNTLAHPVPQSFDQASQCLLPIAENRDQPCGSVAGAYSDLR